MADMVVFPDHHRFTAKDVRRIESRAFHHEVRAIVCTEKDLVRMGAIESSLPFYAVRIEARWIDEDGGARIRSLLSS